MARQGVAMPTLAGVQVADPATGVPVPRDGATMGELMLRGNTIMKGYLDNPAANAKAFAHGWFATGDLAVWHADGYVEIRDRSKDIIITGGENVSSLEVEECLYRHPAVMEAAVVAKPDAHWGESVCAFVTLKPDAPPTVAGGHRRLLPRADREVQGAAHGGLRRAAEDLDREDPEVPAARARAGARRRAATRADARPASAFGARSASAITRAARSPLSTAASSVAGRRGSV